MEELKETLEKALLGSWSVEKYDYVMKIHKYIDSVLARRDEVDDATEQNDLENVKDLWKTFCNHHEEYDHDFFVELAVHQIVFAISILTEDNGIYSKSDFDLLDGKLYYTYSEEDFEDEMDALFPDKESHLKKKIYVDREIKEDGKVWTPMEDFFLMAMQKVSFK